MIYYIIDCHGRAVHSFSLKTDKGALNRAKKYKKALGLKYPYKIEVYDKQYLHECLYARPCRVIEVQP